MVVSKDAGKNWQNPKSIPINKNPSNLEIEGNFTYKKNYT